MDLVHFHQDYTVIDEPAYVAQSDAGLTRNQEVVGSISARSDNSLPWRLTMKYFLL